MNLTRRQAIGTGIAAALQAQDQPMKLGVIGLGVRGNQAHVATLKKLSEARITAICDIQADRMQQINEASPRRLPPMSITAN